MSFIWPGLLVLLLLIPLFVVGYFRLQVRRRQILTQFTAAWTSASLLPGESSRGGVVRTNPGPGIRRHIPPIFFLSALAVFIVALARPQAVVSLPRVEGTVILAFDVSGSMAADDLKPTRMEAAKAAAQDFVQRQPPTVEIGVVAFSDNGLSVQVPTNDQGVVLAAIKRLTPQRGTSLANGILASLSAIAVSNGQGSKLYSNLTPTPAPSPTPEPKGTYTNAVIVLLTDGENNESPDPLAAAQTAADQGVRIYTVGIGSPAGTNLHINGFTVHTQLDEATLQQIATITDGTYYNAENDEDLRQIYDNLNFQMVIKPQATEITSLIAGLGIIVLLIGSAFSLMWFGRLP